MKENRPSAALKQFEFTRANPEQLAKFDSRTKICTMNCGPHRDDQRDNRERKFLCDDCLTTEAPNAELTGCGPKVEK